MLAMAGFISCLDVSSQRLSEKSDQPPQVGRCRGEGETSVSGLHTVSVS